MSNYVDKEVLLEVPKDLARRYRGLGIDIGSSGAKFVYATKEDRDDDSKSKIGRLRVVTFGRENLKEGLEFVRQRAHLFADGSSSNSEVTVYATGVGGEDFSKTVNDALNVRLQVLMEFDCMVKGFCYLTQNLPRQDVVEPYNGQAVSEAVSYMAGVAAMTAKTQSANLSESSSFGMDPQQFLAVLNQSTGWHHASNESDKASELTLTESEENLYPYLLVIAGSCMFSLKVTAPGVYVPGDYSPCCGRTMIGIGNLLTGCKTYDEFVKLASTGNRHNVDQSSADLMKSATDARTTADNNWYKAIEQAPPMLVFNFGKTVGANRDDLKREDIAAAWLALMAEDIARSVQLACQLQKIKRVFIAGGILQHPDVRHAIAKSLMIKNLMAVLSQQTEPLMFDLVKSGGHLAAIGCMVHGLQQAEKGEQ